MIREFFLLLWSMFSGVISYASGEWLLNWQPNGGNVIFLRALILSVLGFLLAIGFTDSLRPNAEMLFDSDRMRCLVGERIEWFAVLFGGAYAALYSRFSAQWEYLANLYNQIMCTAISIDQSNLLGKRKLCRWWAAFIEDADDLHLLRKPMFASVIYDLIERDEWKDVVRDFESSPSGGKERLDRIRSKIKSVLPVVA